MVTPSHAAHHCKPHHSTKAAHSISSMRSPLLLCTLLLLPIHWTLSSSGSSSRARQGSAPGPCLAQASGLLPRLSLDLDLGPRKAAAAAAVVAGAHSVAGSSHGNHRAGGISETSSSSLSAAAAGDGSIKDGGHSQGRKQHRRLRADVATLTVPHSQGHSHSHGGSTYARLTSSSEHALCHMSGYACSAGQVKPWVGDLTPSANLRSMLEARSFKKEIVLFVSWGDHWKLNAAHVWQMWLRHGYAHTVTLMHSEEACRDLAGKFPDFGCGWASDELPPGVWLDWSRGFHLRHRLSARMVHMGYNVMNIDGDTVLLHDPYLWLKQEPLSRFNLLAQDEGAGQINVAFMYAQGAAPDGGVAWLWADMAYRGLLTVQHVEGNDIESAPGKLSWSCCSWEQLLANEALRSARYRQLVFHDCLANCAQDKAWKAANAQHLQRLASDFGGTYLQAAFTFFNFDPPPLFKDHLWHSVLSQFNNQTMVKGFEVAVPSSQATSKELYGDLGGLPFAPSGPYTKAFMQQLQADAPDQPLWPDPYDAATPPVNSSRVEKVGLIGEWMLGTWIMHGKDGGWLRHAPGMGAMPRTASIVGHVHGVPNMEYYMSKMYIPLALGFHDWEVRKAYLGNMTFFTSTPLDPLPRVVALSPSFNLAAAAPTEKHFRELLRSLHKVALLTGRAAAWPSLRCAEHPWLADTTQSTDASTAYSQLPWRARTDVLPMGPAHEPRCLYSHVVDRKCLVMSQTEPCKMMRGMLPLEFAKYLQHDGHVQGDSDVAHLQLQHLPGAQPSSTPGGPIRVSQAAMMEAAAMRFAGFKVLYLDEWFDVEFEGDAKQVFGSCVDTPSCPALKPLA